MPLAAYCKKCKMEVPMGETCCQCSGKLSKGSLRFSFHISHTPWRDWISWNSVWRIAGPVWLVVSAIILGGEALIRDWPGVLNLLMNGTGAGLLIAAAAAVVIIWIWLLLMGREEQYFFIDAKGVSCSTYLPQPRKIQLAARLLPPSRLNQLGETPEAAYGLFVGQRQVAWSSLKRIQLWHDKNRILLYAPAWWMQMAIACPADQFEEAAGYLLEKVAKRKDVRILHIPREMASRNFLD